MMTFASIVCGILLLFGWALARDEDYEWLGYPMLFIGVIISSIMAAIDQATTIAGGVGFFFFAFIVSSLFFVWFVEWSKDI